MQHALELFLTTAAGHTDAALAFVGFVAFAESLAIVGTLVPAAIVMFGAGVLVGHGTMQLGWALAAATAGAIVGDALSYELGRQGQDRVREWSLFRRHSGAIVRAGSLVASHGAASVVIARFTGAVRAFVPLLAGLARMSRTKFYITNVVSALLWAPAHILPGVVFGASLHVAEQASGRLAILMLLIAALLWAAIGIAHLAVLATAPLARSLRSRAFQAIRNRPQRWARVLGLFLDPERPGSQALFAGLLVLLGCMWLFFGIVEDVVANDPLVIADQSVLTFLQQVRAQPADRIMVGITEMGSVGVMLPLVIAVAAWLAARRCWRSCGFWVATVASSEVIVQIMKLTLGRHRPLQLYSGVEQYSFPSGHATMSAVVLAYLAFLVTRRQSTGWRIAVAAIASVYVALVGMSRLYLGAHWLSDVLGGFSFGLAAVAVSAMVYSQHVLDEDIQPKRLAAVATAVIVLAGFIWGAWRSPVDMRIYARTVTPKVITEQAWLAGAYRSLPQRRREIAGELKEPFTLQVACTEPALRDTLRRAGWEPAPSLSLASLLKAIAPNPSIGELPMIPEFDGGLASKLNFTQTTSPSTGSRMVLRLWKSDLELPGQAPIWYGAFGRETQVRANWGFVRQFQQPATELAESLSAGGLVRLEVASATTGQELWLCR